MLNKIRLFLFITKIWAYVGLYCTKTFEFAFRLVLMLPDSLFAPFTKLFRYPRSTNGEDIKMLLLTDDCGKTIINKFKLFLKYAWDTSNFDENGFSIKKFKNLFNTTLIHGCYILLNNKDVKRYFLLSLKNKNARDKYEIIRTYIVNNKEYDNVISDVLYNHVVLGENMPDNQKKETIDDVINDNKQFILGDC